MLTTANFSPYTDNTEQHTDISVTNYPVPSYPRFNTVRNIPAQLSPALTSDASWLPQPPTGRTVP
jgi:hypothetical protein